MNLEVEKKVAVQLTESRLILIFPDFLNSSRIQHSVKIEKLKTIFIAQGHIMIYQYIILFNWMEMKISN